MYPSEEAIKQFVKRIKQDIKEAASKWSTARNINGMIIDGTANRANYGKCFTAGGETVKEVSCEGFDLVVGAEITVVMVNGNGAINPTLNVEKTGAHPIYYRGKALEPGILHFNGTYTFRYNGTQYDLVGDLEPNIYTDNDSNVTQTNTTTNADYRLLLSQNANDTTQTTGARKSSKFKANPSTGELTAPKFVGTASKVENALVFSGAFTGSYDGSEELNVNIPENTDKNVTQTNTTTNADYRLLLSQNASDTTQTTGARKSSKFKANPSTGKLTVTSIEAQTDDCTITFDSYDVEDKNAVEWISGIPKLLDKINHRTFLKRVSAMFHNVRYLHQFIENIQIIEQSKELTINANTTVMEALEHKITEEYLIASVTCYTKNTNVLGTVRDIGVTNINLNLRNTHSSPITTTVVIRMLTIPLIKNASNYKE